MIPVDPVGEVGDPPLHPLAFSRAHFASDNDSKECPEQANGRNAGPPTSPTTATTPTRWPLLCRLLAAPAAESRRLGKLLESWPAERRRFECLDDVKRRQWRCRPKGVVR